MRRQKKSFGLRSLVLSTCLAASALAAALPVSSAQADPIERVLSTPTAWEYYYGLTGDQINTVLASGNYRIVDLQAESATSAGPVFTVALVANTGVYNKAWWWYYNQTGAQVGAALSANNARLISIAPYVVNGTTLFASVMVPNTGTDGKGWYWWVGTAAQISADLSATTARLVDLEPFATSTGTQYAAIAILNSGADADSWWWYLGDTASSLLSQIQTNQAQLLTFNNEPGSAALDATMQGGSTAPWWFYTGLDAPTLNQLVFENGARLTELRSVFNGANRSFNAVMIDNSTACTTRLIGIDHANGTGWNGNYVHEITGSAVPDGPTPCVSNDSRVFEPASAIKVVIATYAWSQVQAGLAKMTDTVPVLDPNNFCSFTQTGTETLANAVTQMMENSDNARTDMLLQRYGLANLTSFAHSLGMPNTAFNGYIDCPGPHNTLTLDDAAALYAGLGQHTLLKAGTVKKMFAQMAGRNYDFAGTWGYLQQIAAQEAPSSLPAAQLASFVAGITLTYKSGGYAWPGGVPDVNGQTEYGDEGIDGIVSLPTCAGKKKVARQFVFGFFHESTASDADQTPVFKALGAGAELLREQVQTSLATWNKCG